MLAGRSKTPNPTMRSRCARPRPARAPGRGTTMQESAELKRLRRENAELRRARDSEGRIGLLRGRARPAVLVLVAFKQVFGVEPNLPCAV
jgi:transposase-like protein